jgi:hypothetical protein
MKEKKEKQNSALPQLPLSQAVRRKMEEGGLNKPIISTTAQQTTLSSTKRAEVEGVKEAKATTTDPISKADNVVVAEAAEVTEVAEAAEAAEAAKMAEVPAVPAVPAVLEVLEVSVVSSKDNEQEEDDIVFIDDEDEVLADDSASDIWAAIDNQTAPANSNQPTNNVSATAGEQPPAVTSPGKEAPLLSAAANKPIESPASKEIVNAVIPLRAATPAKVSAPVPAQPVAAVTNNPPNTSVKVQLIATE